MPTTPAKFWSTPPLQHVKIGALSARTAPDAVLHAILARLAAFTPSDLLLPGIIGGPSPLNYFAALVAPSGGGKSSAAKAAARLLPAPEHLDGRDDLQVGTGEGLIESFLEKDPDTGEKVQVHHNAYLYVDEGEIFRKYARRDGTTLDVVIRTAHSGGALGQTNASKATSRRLAPNSYSIGMVVGLQPGKAGALLTPEAIDGGTPQRFVWAAGQISQSDRLKMEEYPTSFDWPGPLRVNKSVWNRVGEVKINPLLTNAIGDYHLDLLSGRTPPPPALDAHETLITLRMAVLLALLEGRFSPSPADHERARTLWAVNQEVRRWIIKEVNESEQDDLNRQIAKDMQRAQAQVVARDRAQDLESRLESQVLSILERRGGDTTLGVLTNDVTKSLRPYLNGTLQHLGRAGRLTVHRDGAAVRVSLPQSDEIVLDLSESVG
jgi:hypothetical protein